MNKTAIQNLANFRTVAPPPVPSPPAEVKKKIMRQFDYDPQGLAVINELVELCGSLTAAASLLGTSTSAFSNWRGGDPVRTTYSSLARYIIAEHKAKLAPKIVLKPQQHTAIVTLGNEHRDDFKNAVESVNGQYTLLTYEKPNDQQT